MEDYPLRVGIKFTYLYGSQRGEKLQKAFSAHLQHIITRVVISTTLHNKCIIFEQKRGDDYFLGGVNGDDLISSAKQQKLGYSLVRSSSQGQMHSLLKSIQV